MLWGVYVRPKARSAGVARRLVEAVLDHARGRVEQVNLAVERGNMHARRLYTSLGFVEYGLEKNALKIGDRYFDDVLMVRVAASETRLLAYSPQDLADRRRKGRRRQRRPQGIP